MRQGMANGEGVADVPENKKIWILGGTTEGRTLLSLGLPCIYTVATPYGAALAEETACPPHAGIRTGRLDPNAMAALLAEEPIACVLDATHPYAVEVSRNARIASADAGVPYIRVLRERTDTEGVVSVDSLAAAADFLSGQPGQVLVTTGSKEVAPFLRDGLRERVHLRVLPAAPVLERLEGLGIPPGRILALQGPFSEDMNRALLRKVGAAWLVTKDGGPEGGMPEKLQAARAEGVRVVVVGRPEETGLPLADAIRQARARLGLAEPPRFPMWVDLAGAPVVVVGGGRVGRRRAETLRQCGADVTVIDPNPAGIEGVRQKHRPFEPGDLLGARLAVASTGRPDVNAEVVREARERGIPVSCADNAQAGTFHFPSLVREGDVAVSVSSGGRSPTLTHRLAERLRAVWNTWVAQAVGGVEPAEGVESAGGVEPAGRLDPGDPAAAADRERPGGRREASGSGKEPECEKN